MSSVVLSHGQGYIDLNFENAVIVQDTSSLYYPNAVYASNAMPGWTITGSFLGPNDISYNALSLGAPCVSILETNGVSKVIDGAFSVNLYGGTPTSSGVSISQTGVVPPSAISLLFKAQPGIGTLLVSLGGQNLSFETLAVASDYTLYSASIPAGFAGQSEQLAFSALEGNNNYWTLDDIQFSTSSVPEPSALGLSALGGLFLAWRCRKARAI
jgi:hypothetical protein